MELKFRLSFKEGRQALCFVEFLQRFKVISSMQCLQSSRSLFRQDGFYFVAIRSKI